jgi:hypothetical protein
LANDPDSQLLAGGPEQDLVHVYFFGLAQGERDGPRERVGGDRESLVELLNVRGGVLVPETTLNATISLSAAVLLRRMRKGAWDCTILRA